MNVKPELFFVHFDVKDHYIKIENHVSAISATNVIIGELNKRLFGGKLEYELLVFPCQSGSLKTILGIVAVTWIGIQITETKAYTGFVEGLTGYKWDNYVIAKDVGSFLGDMTKGFFTIETSELERIIPSEINLDKAIKSKSEFYKECISNGEVMAMGFDDSNKFPIIRNQFACHVMPRDKIRVLPSEFIIIEATIITSVNVDKDVQWKIRDNLTNQEINAHMKDLKFKSRFLNGKRPLKELPEDDIIQLLLEYKKQEKNGEVEIKEKSIDTVYSFNGEELESIPDNLLKNIKFKSDSKLPMDGLWHTND